MKRRDKEAAALVERFHTGSPSLLRTDTLFCVAAEKIVVNPASQTVIPPAAPSAPRALLEETPQL